MQYPLLPGNAANKDDVRLIGSNPGSVEKIGGLSGAVGIRIDTVVHYVYAIGVDEWVGVQNVITHAVTHRDDGVCCGISASFDPRGDPVTTAELLLLPWPSRLKGVGGDHVWDPVEEAAEVAGQVCVPGVRVQEVCPNCVTCHLQVHSEGLEGEIRTSYV